MSNTRFDIFLSFRGETEEAEEWVRDRIIKPLHADFKDRGWNTFFDEASIIEKNQDSYFQNRWDELISTSIGETRGVAVFLITETFLDLTSPWPLMELKCFYELSKQRKNHAGRIIESPIRLLLYLWYPFDSSSPRTKIQQFFDHPLVCGLLPELSANQVYPVDIPYHKGKAIDMKKHIFTEAQGFTSNLVRGSNLGESFHLVGTSIVDKLDNLKKKAARKRVERILKGGSTADESIESIISVLNTAEDFPNQFEELIRKLRWAQTKWLNLWSIDNKWIEEVINFSSPPPPGPTLTLKLFRMDMFSGMKYEDENVVKCFCNALGRLEQDEVVEVYNPNPEPSVPNGAYDMPWADWQKIVHDLSKALNRHLGKVDVVLSGKAPLSMFLYLGYLLSNQNLYIANQFETWQLFNMQNQLDCSLARGMLQVEDLFESPFEDRNSKYGIVFISLNISHKLNEVQRQDISAAITRLGHGHVCDDSGFYQIKPTQTLVLLPMGMENAEGDSSITIDQLKANIRVCFEQIQGKHKGLVIVTTGPQPLAYMVGMLYKPSLYGNIILCERDRNGYQVAVCTCV